MREFLCLLTLPAALSALVPHRGASRFFLDTADEAEWASLLPLGIFHGVTTNPVLLQRAGVECTVPSCHHLARRAFDYGAAEVMLQAWGGSADALVSCGQALSGGDERVVVKVPITAEGTRAASVLGSLGIRVCLTACYASEQALVATAVGAEYLAPYLGRMDDAGKDGRAECERMEAIISGLGGSTRVLVASIRHVDSLARLAAAGLDTFTFSPAVARELFEVEPLTTAAAAEFEAAALAAPELVEEEELEMVVAA